MAVQTITRIDQELTEMHNLNFRKDDGVFFSRRQIVRDSRSVWECDKRLVVHEVEVAEGRVGPCRQLDGSITTCMPDGRLDETRKLILRPRECDERATSRQSLVTTMTG